jgi:hypothetical protein
LVVVDDRAARMTLAAANPLKKVDARVVLGETRSVPP